MDWSEIYREINPIEEGAIFEKEFQDVTHGQEVYVKEEVYDGIPVVAVDEHPSSKSTTHDEQAEAVLSQTGVYRLSPEEEECDIDVPVMIEYLENDVPETVDSPEVPEVPGETNLQPELSETPAITIKEETPPILSITPKPSKSTSVRVDLPESTLPIPRSCYEPFEPGAPIVSEGEAIHRLLWAAKQAGQDPNEFVEFQLDNFAVYRDNAQFPTEMRSLHQLDTKLGHKNFFFDGMLSVGEIKFFVKRVPIAALPVDNYGTLSAHTTRDKIWLRSDVNITREIYYKLQTPAKEYRRFFEPFLWVADLAKHFVDFLKVMAEHKRKVTIFHFRTTFSTWLNKVHKAAPAFVAWKTQHPSEDYRTSIVANIAFLYKEAMGVLGYDTTYSHTLWAEIWDFSYYKPFVNGKENPPTVVTQYIYDCFEHLPFGDRLEAVPLSKETQALRNKVIQKCNLELPSPIHSADKDVSTAVRRQIQDIKVGDTISTQRDNEESGTQWRRDISHGFNDVDRWFALVQSVKKDRRGKRVFDVIWYYRAVDTLCGLMKYPWNNELFLSDHCSCGERSKISEDEVLGVHDVDFFGTSHTVSEFFCRQTYFHAERKWITLQNDHLRCEHVQKVKKTPMYRPGDTYLVVLTDKARSEPCEFVMSYQEDGSGVYRFRRLLRRKEVDPTANAPPNELVYSEQLMEVKRKRIQQPCFVRFFNPGQTIPTPYDRDGVGGFFFITHQESYTNDGTRSFTPLTTFPTTMKQAYDPDVEVPKLRGLDLFCGGGNFGRGLEDGGGIEMKWANDYEKRAIHTYMANVSAPEAVSPFLGSIDDLQRLAIKGRFARNVPRIGEVDFISGGSPCPGFSHLTNDKTTLAQRKNQSLVAAFGSFIDLYRPKYGLLENVTGIVQRKASRDQDVFSQLICAIVGLGYQTQFFFLDASSCGSPQRRARVFLAFAAPGYKLPSRPLQTHAHPAFTKTLSLGNLPNGQSMAERSMPEATPFDFISAAAATADLPPVYDAKPEICVPYPDHRISLGITKQLRSKISLIPTQPWGMNFATAWYGPTKRDPGSGPLTASEREYFPKPSSTSSMSRTHPNSNAYGRQYPNRLIETVVTGQSPSDAKNGRTLHWKENRVLTIMEARRAQGFRDQEVLLGLPPDQYRVVGNSVARHVAVALGVVFREAWIESLKSNNGDAAIPANILIRQEDKTVLVEESTSEPSTDTDPDATLRRISPSPTPATTIASPTPPPTQKRARSGTTLAVEISAKAGKTSRSSSPSSLVGSVVHGTVVQPSPLGRTVVVIDED